MAEEEKKRKAVKKTAAKKKSVPLVPKESKLVRKTSSEVTKNLSPKETPTPSKKPIPKIYNDSNFTKHPTFPSMDLVKVLVRSPKEAFVFWKFSSETMERITKELESPNTEGLKFRLKVEYQNVFGSDRVEWMELLPFTESYYMKFMFPVRHVQCTIFVSFGEKEIPTLHATGKDLPQGTESFRLDKEWIHPKWVEAGLVVESPGGEFYFRDEDPSGYYVNPRNQTIHKEGKAEGNFPFANGSGSGKGIL